MWLRRTVASQSAVACCRVAISFDAANAVAGCSQGFEPQFRSAVNESNGSHQCKLVQRLSLRDCACAGSKLCDQVGAQAADEQPRAKDPARSHGSRAVARLHEDQPPWCGFGRRCPTLGKALPLNLRSGSDQARDAAPASLGASTAYGDRNPTRAPHVGPQEHCHHRQSQCGACS